MFDRLNKSRKIDFNHLIGSKKSFFLKLRKETRNTIVSNHKKKILDS